MRSEFKHVSTFLILTIFLVPSVSVATFSDLKWKVQEGDEIRYQIRGYITTGSVGDLTIEDEMYFIIDDLSGIPIPGVSGVYTEGAPSVSAYWKNDSLIYDDDWFPDISVINAIVVRVGNWSLYSELTYDFFELRNDQYSWIEPPYEPFMVYLNEKTNVWNVTVTYSSPSGSLMSISSFSYSKTDGVLKEGSFVFFSQSEPGESYYLSITQIDNELIMLFGIIIIAAILIALSVVIILVRKK
ncbi:MAG: hypothetical protein ACFFE2_08005 [Candidatus Thorarchaeota archaeon]